MQNIVYALLLLTVILPAKPSMAQNVLPSGFNIQGHRGCRGLMPENSIPGMVHAIGYPVVTLEMDVVITKDKQVILSHEPFFSHEISTKPDGSYISAEEEKLFNIYEMTYDEVSRFDVGLKPHPRFPKQQKMAVSKPLLSDLFDAIRNEMMTRRRPMPYYNIEIKSQPVTDGIYHPGPEEFADLVMKVVNEKNLESQTIIQSFDIRILQHIKKQYPSMLTALLIEEGDTRQLKEQLDDLGFIPEVYSPHYSLATKERIKESHDQKMQIIPWTVNDKALILSLKNWGVDGVITDYPDLLP